MERKASCNCDLGDGEVDRRGRLEVTALSNGKDHTLGGFSLVEEMVNPVGYGFG